MKAFQFRENFSVRDYECDLAGMVNNANYLRYLEHARHEYLRQKGINFSELAGQGIYLVVLRVEVDYLFPMRSGDEFFVGINVERVSRLRIGFMQEIYRLPDQKPILRGKVIGAAINDLGRPMLPDVFETLLG